MSQHRLEPQQKRSRETSARLIRATMQTLETHGLDGATLPRIASAAGLAPASVYRRFQDRDALYRATMLHVLEISTHKDALRSQLQNQPFETAAHMIVELLLQQYRKNPGFLRALTRFLQTDTDEHFRGKALGYIAMNFASLVDMLLVYRDQIPHPDPCKALTFALLTASTVVQVRALETVSMWQELTHFDDQEFTAEVTRTFLGYLRRAT